jgi:hypothetical protein
MCYSSKFDLVRPRLVRDIFGTSPEKKRFATTSERDVFKSSEASSVSNIRNINMQVLRYTINEGSVGMHIRLKIHGTECSWEFNMILPLSDVRLSSMKTPPTQVIDLLIFVLRKVVRYQQSELGS